ncbi:MAG: hypothetical protein WBF81_09420 [Thermoplasmata archaeon]
METNSGHRIAQREVPGTRLTTSSIALAIDATTLGSPAVDRRSVAVLRRARSLGVTTFEVPGGRGARRAERLLAEALPAFDEAVVVLLRRSVRSLAEEGSERPTGGSGDDLAARLRESLLRSAARLAPLTAGLVEWDPGGSPGAPTPGPAELFEPLRGDGVVRGWVLAVTPDSPLASSDGVSTPDVPRLFAGGLSPLDPRLIARYAERAARVPTGFFARDPLGSGRLDGSRFAGSVVDRRPDQAPVNVRDLRREFAPVLRLAFLTQGRGRTLAQASLGFVLRWPWVCSALVPVPAPERLEELLGAEVVAPVTAEEAERVLALGP